jgi:hypothetical protein
LRLVEPNLTAVEREAIEGKVRDAILAYVEALPMGEPLVHAKLLGLVVAPDAVADASMLVGPAGAPPTIGRNVVANGRKLTAQRREVAVYLMDQPVRIDVLVRLTEAADASGRASEVTPALQAAIKDAIAAVPATGQPPTRAAVAAAAGSALAAAETELILAEEAPIVLNATYVESGRRLSDAETVSLEESEVAVLGDVSVERIGVLDG